ncbi:hypothetical protein EKH55_5393 [Sinorhizobium alkalisoli]|nr:hypothetical protein EKH55_5393 [Sinorhizobium alkalisoli]
MSSSLRWRPLPLRQDGKRDRLTGAASEVSHRRIRKVHAALRQTRTATGCRLPSADIHGRAGFPETSAIFDRRATLTRNVGSVCTLELPGLRGAERPVLDLRLHYRQQNGIEMAAAPWSDRPPENTGNLT